MKLGGVMESETHMATFCDIQKEEFARIKKRRICANINEKVDPKKDVIGLALSGGGIRSASFNLGILQALERNGLLKYIDYLSTVSGGGFIGSSLTWFMSQLKRKEFPFGTSHADNAGFPGKVVARLRARGKYLTPGDGLTLWAFIATIIVGILINFLVLLPAFFSAIWILKFDLPILMEKWAPGLGRLIYQFASVTQITPTLFSCLWFSGIILFLAFSIIATLYSLTTRIPFMCRFVAQRWTNKSQGKILMFGVLFFAIGTIPFVYNIIDQHKNWIEKAISLISLSGVASVGAALKGKKLGNEAKGFRSFFLSIGLSLVVFGIFLGIYHLEKFINEYRVYLYFLIFSYILATVADINQVSMHRFYRNRLLEAYMPYRLSDEEPILDHTGRSQRPQDADKCSISKIPQTSAPYHIINTNVQTVSSPSPKFRERGGDNFIFSPCFCGAESTGYLKTQEYIKGKTNLATAMAISGAAVDPNTYVTRSRPLNFLMTILNVRLGYWIRNPRYNNKKRAILWRNPTWYSIFIEMFGRGLNEKRWSIHLSDGGHFENLGLYELVKRRCRCIIVCDATADPGYLFEDLGKAVELVRVDFGAKVDLNTKDFIPEDKKNKISKSAWVKGKIIYDNKEEGDLIYITTTLIEDLPEDIYAYQRRNSKFPDQGSGDQFFDEQQFEAYRELGFNIGHRFFQERKHAYILKK